MGRKIELLASYWTVAGDAYALGPNEVATFPLKDRIEAIAEVGYKGMGLAYFDLLHNKEKYGYATMKRMLNDHGINHVEVEFLGAEDDGEGLDHINSWLGSFAPGRRVVRRLLFKLISSTPYRPPPDGPVLIGT